MMACLVALGCLAGCAPPDPASERLGQSQLPLSLPGSELVHSTHLSTEHLSSAWIPAGGNGSIVSAYTVGNRAAYSYMPSGWLTGGTPPSGSLSAYSDDSTYGWPAPENFCDVYECQRPSPAAFEGYVSAHAVLAPGWRGAVAGHPAMAAIVAIGETSNCGYSRCYDIVVLTSNDGGEHFTRAEIVSLNLISGGLDTSTIWRAIRAESVHATTLLTPEVGSMEQLTHSAPIYVVWKAEVDLGGVAQDPRWYAVKVLVEPETGDIVLLNRPRVFPVDDDTATVTLSASQGRDGHETLAMVTSTRLDPQTLNPLSDLPTCPTDETIEVHWRYAQLRGFWHGDTPNFPVAPGVFKVDPDWRPCVGASHDGSSGGSRFYPNSDRAALAVHRTSANHGWGYEPAIEHIAFAMTDPISNKSRIHQIIAYFEIDSGNVSWVTSGGFLPVEDEDEEEILPQVVINQGAAYDFDPGVTEAATSSLIRKRILANKTDVVIVGRAYPFIWEEWGTKKAWLAPAVISDGALTGVWTPQGGEGRSLGLTVFQHCSYDFYGTCNPSMIAGTRGPVYFYGTWARSENNDGVLGRAFEP